MGEGVTAAEHQVLPLAHIAQIVVVQQNHLYRCLLLHDGAEFLDVHLETAVAEETADGAVGSSEGGTDGCRKAEAHGSENHHWLRCSASW